MPMTVGLKINLYKIQEVFIMKFKPENYIKAVKKTPQLKEMGIVEKDSKYDIIASEFIKYCMKRIAVHQNEEEFWFYNYKTQQYEQLSDSRIRKVFFNMICEPNDNIWNAAIEKKYIDYFRRYVTEFQTTGYEPGILQFTNGILDFSGENVTFAKASPKYFCQFRLPYEYHEDAECPQFMDFLDAIHYHVRSEGQIVSCLRIAPVVHPHRCSCRLMPCYPDTVLFQHAVVPVW